MQYVYQSNEPIDIFNLSSTTETVTGLLVLKTIQQRVHRINAYHIDKYIDLIDQLSNFTKNRNVDTATALLSEHIGPTFHRLTDIYGTWIVFAVDPLKNDVDDNFAVFYFVCLCSAYNILYPDTVINILLTCKDISIVHPETYEFVNSRLNEFIEQCNMFVSGQQINIMNMDILESQYQCDTMFVLSGIHDNLNTYLSYQTKPINIIAQGNDTFNGTSAEMEKGNFKSDIPSNVRFDTKQPADNDKQNIIFNEYIHFIELCATRGHKFYSFPLSRDKRPFTIKNVNQEIVTSDSTVAGAFKKLIDSIHNPCLKTTIITDN